MAKTEEEIKEDMAKVKREEQKLAKVPRVLPIGSMAKDGAAKWTLVWLVYVSLKSHDWLVVWNIFYFSIYWK